MPPASAENPFIGTTTSAQTTMPQVMDGTPLRTSAANRTHQLRRDEPYSDRNTPPSTPMGTPSTAACPIRRNQPSKRQQDQGDTFSTATVRTSPPIARGFRC